MAAPVLFAGFMQARITSVGLVIEPDPADLFSYPHHIDRASLDALPAGPGIYIFRDMLERPLYIGKSVNIRSRVLAHLRAPGEALMLQQARMVEFRRTAGEIGALLLESRLIKQLQPLHNKKLRRTREMCAWRLASTGIPQIVYARDLDFAGTKGLFGLFATRRGALEKLRALVDTAGLCPALCGLEHVIHGRACFAHQIGRCRGACVGVETGEQHAARLREALEQMRVMIWPYAGPVAILEESEGWQQSHVVDHWFYLGSIDHPRIGPPARLAARTGFDVDTYQILVKPLLQGELCVRQMPAPRGRRR
jgi:excinuclease Cho